MSVISNKTFDEIEIGDSASMERTLTRRDLELFAVSSGDYNPTHLSEEFGEIIFGTKKVSAHGMWGAALFSALLGNELPGAGTIYKSQQLEFIKIVSLGDKLYVSVTVRSKDPQSKEIIFDCTCKNQNDEDVLTGEACVLAPTQKISGEQDLPEVHVTRGHHVFERLIERCQDHEKTKVAVCHPCDQVSLLGPIEAAKKNIIEPILIGPKDRIMAVAEENGVDISAYEIIDTEHSHESAEKAVAMCRAGEAEALMKGSLHTDEMMREVTNKVTGLRTGRRLSHIFVMDVPTYHKTLLVTDAAINIYPSLEDKVDICQNAIDLAHIIGVEMPKVAILSAVETIYPKIASTLEAAALCKMADRGQIKGGLLDGPLAFDNAISKEAAMIKKINSEVAGDADILLVPDLEAGNMLAKQLAYLADSDAAGIVLGARVPIVLTSRADSPDARLASCAVGALFAHARRHGEVKKMT